MSSIAGGFQRDRNGTLPVVYTAIASKFSRLVAAINSKKSIYKID